MLCERGRRQISYDETDVSVYGHEPFAHKGKMGYAPLYRLKGGGFSMKILHTSDWHLGRSLYGRKRYDEFEAFLNWLAVFIRDERIDVLLVAGDVFDTSLPSNRAQALYYRFLGRVS